ncbi:MAG: oligosaccharide flippase family protein [Candidatus Aegiribacteria sp.]
MIRDRSSKAANSAWMLSGQFIGKGSLFISVMFLSRYLSDSDFGGLLFALVLGQIYLFLSDMGVSLVLNRRASMRPDDTQELLSASMTLRLILTLLGFPLMLAAGLLLGMSGDRLLIQGIIGLSVFFESYAEMFYSVFRAGERMMFEGFSRVSKGITGLVLVLLVIGLDLGLTAVAFSYVIRTAAATAVAFGGLRSSGFSIRPLLRRDEVKELFLASLPLGIMGLVTIIHQRADNILIRQMLGENAVAAWQQCMKIIELMVLLVVPTLLPGALFPSLCRAYRDGGHLRETGDMARVFTAFAVAVSLSVVSTGNRFLRFVWGSDYLRDISASSLQICLYLALAGLAVVYLMHILLASLLAVNKVRIVIPVTAAAMVLVITGNLVLIPMVGLPSAGIFYLAGNLMILLSYWFFLRWRGYSLPIWREALISIAVSMPAFAIIPLTRSMGFLPALVLPVAVYVPVWWFTGGGRAVGRLFPGRSPSTV